MGSYTASKNSTASAHVDQDGNKVDAGAANEFKPLRFGVNVSMTEGSDTDTSGEKVFSNVQATVNADGSTTIPYTKTNESIVIELPEVMDLNKYKGISITGFASAQVSLELYGEDFDMSKDREEWWNLPTNASPGYNRWTTYPFFDGSCIGRWDDGTNSGVAGIETIDTLWKKGHKVGDISAVKYIVIKTNKQTLFKKATFKIDRVAFMKKDGTADIESPSVETPAN